jgi:hypothetical protein
VGTPKWIKPQLTRLVDDAPVGGDWVHEIKYDGYRMHARIDRGKIQLLTRTGLDWSHRYRGRSTRFALRVRVCTSMASFALSIQTACQFSVGSRLPWMKAAQISSCSSRLTCCT